MSFFLGLTGRWRNPNFLAMLAADTVIFVLSVILAFFVRFDFHPPWEYLVTAVGLIPVALGVKLAVYAMFGMYRGMWRYTDIRDSWRLFQAGGLASLLIVAWVAYTTRLEGFPRSFFLIDFGLTFFMTGGLRVLIRSFFLYRSRIRSSVFLSPKEYARRRQRMKNVLILGAGDAGEKLLREILENPGLGLNVAGFLDDDADKKGRSVHGVPILGPIDELDRQVKSLDINQVFIAMPSAKSEVMRRVVTACEESGVTFKTVPGLAELVDGRVRVSDLREVSFQDLLGREPVRLDHSSIIEYLHDTTVLVTGAGGSIGSELCRQLVRFGPKKLVLVDASEFNLFQIQTELVQERNFARIVPVLGSVANADLMDRVMESFGPSVVFHAAAYKHVPMLEGNPWQAVENNVRGTRAIMEAALAHGVKRFVVVSTDKAVRPTNVMGASKRVTELLMHSMAGRGQTRFMAVRFGNVVGSSGSVVPLFKRQIARGGPVTVTHPEVTRYFMTIEEAAQLILQAGALAHGGEVFILDMGTPVRIMDMARDLIRLMGKEPETDIPITITGLRPGEKLYEELITRGEGIVPAGHERIMVLGSDQNSDVGRPDFQEWLLAGLGELEAAARDRDGVRIRQILGRLVPEYDSAGNGDIFRTVDHA
ncbi:MAG: polysaccharide biosynthesis protein [Verrucomicrobiae bacterium]|nr:polysaccharide biosynthesis protein [Verrucomicrobiae bacterium]